MSVLPYWPENFEEFWNIDPQIGQGSRALRRKVHHRHRRQNRGGAQHHSASHEKSTPKFAPDSQHPEHCDAMTSDDGDSDDRGVLVA